MSHTRTFFVLFLAIFVAMLGVGVIAPTMPLYARTLGATGLWLGIIYATFAVSRAIFMPLVGKFSDIRGRKIFIILGLTVYTVVSFGYIWSNSVIQITWIRFLHGLGSAMVIPIAAAVIGDISPRGKEGSMMGNFQVALFLGFGAGPLLGGVVLDTLGMSAVFYSMGALSFLSLILVILFLPEKKNDQDGRKSKVSSFNALWFNQRFRGLFIFRFSNAVGRAAIITFLPVFASNIDVNFSQVGVLVSLNILLTGILQHFFGRLADRFSRPLLIISGNLLAALSMLLTPFARDFIHLAGLGIIMGVGGGIAFPAAGAIATEVGRDHGMGNVMGYFNMAMSFGSILGAVVAGWVMDLFGLAYVFIFGGLIGFLGSGGCAYWMYKEPHGYQLERS